MHSLGAGAHHDHNALGIRGAHIVKEMILTTHDLGKAVHGLLHDLGRGHIVLVHRLAGREEHVGVLGGAAQNGVIGRHGPGAMLQHVLVIDHRAHLFLVKDLNLLNLVRGAEAIEKVQERHAGFQGRGLGDESHVSGFLDVVGAE